MLNLKSRTDLQNLIDEALPESLTLDYKASPALNKTSDGRTELVKDVTAFANSAGGQIIYGIPEKNGVPQAFDSGVDCDQIPPEWIGQVIDTNSFPRIQGLVVTKIALDPAHPNMVAYAITVPQSLSANITFECIAFAA
jgi:predicted HTH transcriptional regulator